MPTHVYQPVRNPPSWVDRLLVHPIDSAVSVLSLAFGILAALSLVLPGFTPSKSLDSMPMVIVLLFGLFLAAGGGMAITGLNWSGDDVSDGWALERFGWVLATAGFATYALAVSWHFPESVFSWLFPVVLALGTALRCWSVARIEKAMRLRIAEVKGATVES